MKDTYEYYCIYCSEPQLHMDIVFACHACGEYKGIVKVGPEQTNEEE